MSRIPFTCNVLLGTAICAFASSVSPAFAQPSKARGAFYLPAYAHNDYENPQPLHGALELGYSGVEVDFFLIDGELRVGHTRGATRRGVTLEALYLDPLREIVQAQGRVARGDTPFLLNIESKVAGMESYRALHRALAGYDDMLVHVRDGVEVPGAVRVVLVGWTPPLDTLAAQPVRYAAAQFYYDDLPENHASYPAHLVAMISQTARDKRLQRGKDPSPRFIQRLEAVAVAAHEVPGRIARLYRVPSRPSMLDAALDAGVDVIGTTDIDGAAAILRSRAERDAERANEPRPSGWSMFMLLYPGR